MNSNEKTRIIEALSPPSDKLMQTFRMPRELVAFLKAEAARGGRDLTAQVVRCLEGIRTHFGLPEAAAALLDADRKRLGMERYEYLLHALYQRSLEIREKGSGFDVPGSDEGGRR
jgi:hypothetical protein